jgi:hypothetical protein
VPRDHDFLAIFDEVEQLGELGFRRVNIDVHDGGQCSPFFGLDGLVSRNDGS